MGRFSPTVPQAPSWTNGLAEGVNSLAQSLIQRKRGQREDMEHDREFALQSQQQDVRNAEAGYTPAQPMTTATPEGLDRISNAGVSDAGLPAQYDPTKGLTYALMNGRNVAAQQRVETQVQGREDVQTMRGDQQAGQIGLKYGTMGPNGYQAGVMPQAHVFQGAPGLAQKNDQFLSRESDRAAQMAETIKHHRAEEAYPRGPALHMSNGGGGAGAGPTATERTNINNNTAKYQLPQKVAGAPNADGTPSLLTRNVPGLSPDAASAKAVHNVNMTRQAFGQDTLSNPASVHNPPAVANAPATAQHVPRDSHTVPAAVPVQGNVPTLNKGQVTDQHTSTVSGTIPKSPTDGNTAPAKAPLSLKDRGAASKDPGFAKFLESKGYKKGTDY